MLKKGGNSLKTPDGKMSIVVPTERPPEVTAGSEQKYFGNKTPSNRIEWQAGKGYTLQGGESVTALEHDLALMLLILEQAMLDNKQSQGSQSQNTV